jgi:hypothetical protein
MAWVGDFRTSVTLAVCAIASYVQPFFAKYLSGSTVSLRWEVSGYSKNGGGDET